MCFLYILCALRWSWRIFLSGWNSFIGTLIACNCLKDHLRLRRHLQCSWHLAQDLSMKSLKLDPGCYWYLCQKRYMACFTISAFNFLLIICSVFPKKNSSITSLKFTCTIWPEAAKTRSLKGTAASSSVPRGGIRKTTTTRVQEGTHPGPQGLALWYVPIWVTCVNSQWRWE